MSKRTGLISHQTDNELLYVFVPGKHPDLVIDQRKISNDGEHFHVGDFISFIDINGSVTSPTRISKLFETRLVNNTLQVKVSVAFPPEEFSERANFTTFSTKKVLAWSPDFAFVGCSSNVAKTFYQNQMYKAWIERVPRMIQNIAGVFVSWQIVDDVFDECDEQSKQLISKAYIDNYEGLVTAVHDSDAKVWSLAIPDSEVVFFFGARKGMKVGDWVQFNCAPIQRPYLNCYLQGKKFEAIEPVLPAKAFNKTVQVEILAIIAVNNLKYYPTGEVTVETETLGAVEFGSRKFRQDYCNKCLPLIVCKNMPSKRTGAVWEVFCVVNKGCTEFMQNSCSVVNFSNASGNSEEFVSTTRDECNAKVETNDNYHFTKSQQQRPDLSSDLPGTTQKEVDDNFYSGFSYTCGNGDVENLKAEEEEYDPLKEPVFGAVQPHVFQINSSADTSGTDGLYTLGNPSTSLNEEFSNDEQRELDNRATEYWVRAWQIPEVRRQIAEADKILYADVMQLMTDLNMRTDDKNLKEVLKSFLNRKTNDER
ncbi:unnamed protein product [Acanthocheilonema viteae]|uniref:p-granule-associated protein DEPS-1 second OB-fold domain-containing protein n=1 Tax=Acanthocheilonema viteae TaxID=6277 RepID=A0A498SFS2_ACAVI|nr:unnamed protein product [Acanthocheilonema viteae]